MDFGEYFCWVDYTFFILGRPGIVTLADKSYQGAGDYSNTVRDKA
jgi:hypothetical protein